MTTRIPKMAPAAERNSKSSIVVYGLRRDAGFHQASLAADFIYQKFPHDFVKPKSTGFLECDWIEFVSQLKKERGKELWGFDGSTSVFINDIYCGDQDEFLSLAKKEYDIDEFRPLPFFHALAKQEYKKFLLETKHDFVFMTLSSGDENGTLIIELFTDRCPRTCENFKQLCVGDKTEATRHDPPCRLAYKSSIIHRIVKNGWIQGGDIVAGKGDGGESIYGETFEDENFSVEHNRRGLIGMANKGPHTNSSQFYITLQATHWMDRKYVAFGQIIEGLHLLDILETQDTYNERPQKEWKISDCGIVDVANMFEA